MLYWEGPLRARLAWDLLTTRTSLFGAVLLGKYGRLIGDPSSNRSDSPAWAAL
ncbi:hypothetical protein KSP40_PGU004033 [Platanthera guangdongensis]|uniref:Photosystem II CP43 chlorophyll apoprotein n=1 Tax=Platanthera guangdongensis TaxID=2320717 RepID=A0ABR2M064_9ASPA